MATVLYGGEERQSKVKAPAQTQPPEKKSREKPSKYCNTTQHYTIQCINFQLLSKEQKEAWIKTNQRCRKCGHEHLAAQCRLKAKCKKCERKHPEILHKVNASSKATASTKPAVNTAQTLYVDWPAGRSKVLLKMSRVILRSGTRALNTYTLLDDGSERTILLHKNIRT
ncbi:hypothetical protein AAFF_G00177170 [Aldrovandia affinis]|uniref:Uncharacterized protein n=1 Tax=Aldrovandia affinis TaxID=143900 RepID=A0AAD7RKS8_9TELE|nr:hypothetical protein AAFF_G00177170 [Aldrovandia affinis]